MVVQIEKGEKMLEYNIRYATQNDIPSIMKFIDENWKKGHILSRNRELFEWQYISDKVNMIIAEDKKFKIQAILGFIVYGNDERKDISLSLWKAKEKTGFLGMKLLVFLLNEEPHRYMFCNGINIDSSEKIYHRLGIETAKLKQWYRLRPCEKYQIAKIIDKTIPNVKKNDKLKLVNISYYDKLIETASDKLFDSEEVPFKSHEYIKKRYFNHSIYKYIVMGVQQENNQIETVIVFRVQEYRQQKVLRIIDVIGRKELIYEVTIQIDNIAENLGAEYIDMYEIGLDKTKMYKAGYRLVGENENIIPNYFAPFVQSNIDINICTTYSDIVLFKGDGDQDRPN